MVDIAGVDIAGLIAESWENVGGIRPGVLIRTTPGGRDPDDSTVNLPPTTTRHTFDGYQIIQSVQREGTLTDVSVATVGILGQSVRPLIVPEAHDRVEMDGFTYELTRLASRDPAGALYVFEVA